MKINIKSTDTICSDNTSEKTGAYYTGNYRNLFTEFLDISESEVQTKVDKAWDQLFNGDNNTERVYYPVEPRRAAELLIWLPGSPRRKDRPHAFARADPLAATAYGTPVHVLPRHGRRRKPVLWYSVTVQEVVPGLPVLGRI